METHTIKYEIDRPQTVSVSQSDQILIPHTYLSKMRLFNLLWLLIVGSLGIGSGFAQADAPPSQSQAAPQVWQVQPVTMPKLDRQAARQALLLHQKQIAGKVFNCDCPTCKLAALQLGVKLN